mmetsp:Transcript_3853/g.7074  ORF Transcript_3853/g.7074 Transcript_3853/m.7074 type:complete len:487 (-) Transcript_3853:1879-3339(-)
MWVSGFALMLLFVYPSIVNAGITFVSPEELVGLDFGAVVKKKKHLGLARDVQNETRVRIMLAEDVERFCFSGLSYDELWDEFFHKFGNSILFLPEGSLDEERGDYQSCFGDNPRYKNVSFYTRYCKLNSTLIFEESRQPSLFANDHDGYKYRDLYVYRKYKSLRKCEILEYRASESTNRLIEVYKESKHIMATLTLDENQCTAVFANGFVVFWFRGVLGVGYLTVAILSLLYLFSNTYRFRETQIVNRLVLSLNFGTCLLLGVSCLNGGFRLTDSMSMDVSNFVLTTFGGTHGATDYLIATRWHSIQSRMKNQSPSKYFRIKYWATVVLALIMVTIDWTAAVAYTNMSHETQHLLTYQVPLFFLVLQCLIIPFLVLQVRQTVLCLCHMRESIEQHLSGSKAEERSSGAIETYRTQGLLIKRLSRMLSVSIVCLVMSILCLLVIGTTNMIQDTCKGWVGICKLLTTVVRLCTNFVCAIQWVFFSLRG